MKSEFRRVFVGARWTLIYGKFASVERTAVIELQKLLQYYVPYTLVVEQAGDVTEYEHLALVGTLRSNPLIARLVEQKFLPEPTDAQGYAVALMDSPWKPGCRLLVVAGADEAGVLHGVQEAAALLFCGGSLLDGIGASGWGTYLEAVEPFSIREAPGIPNRGLWTWGYPIASYRRYLDNMMRLKMNMLTIWNDQVPLNVEDVIAYAHARGIRVILGFHWGWGHKGSVDLSKAEDRLRIQKSVLETYRSKYAHLSHDGIYFQTLTEHKDLELAGRSTAHWVVQLVNATAAELLSEFPKLAIQCGLHATSIGDRYGDLAGLDSRVTIVWEDCGGQIPYSYFPVQEVEVSADFGAVLEYSKKLAVLRPETKFALVPKGWSCIRWQRDFENHGAFILGEKSALSSRERLFFRRNEWDRINAHWYENYPLAARFYREMLAVNPDITATALVEDGAFEEVIQPSVALFAETLWSPYQSDSEILCRAMRPWYSRIAA